MTLIKINKYYLPTYLERLKRDNKEDTNDERRYYLERRASTRRKTSNARLRELEELTPINKNYTSLAWALLSFKLGYNQNAVTDSLEEQKEFLRALIVTETIKIEKLKKEFNHAVSSNTFKWVEFLMDNKILATNDKISNDDEAKEWVKMQLTEFL